MTIRRAQGSTLDTVGLLFDRRCADRGYAYVGSSRVRRRDDLWLVGRVRRTDWLPVGDGTDEDELWWPATKPHPNPKPRPKPKPNPNSNTLPTLTRWPATVTRLRADGRVDVRYADGPNPYPTPTP